jgi:hypothetical protein
MRAKLMKPKVRSSTDFSKKVPKRNKQVVVSILFSYSTLIDGFKKEPYESESTKAGWRRYLIVPI